MGSTDDEALATTLWDLVWAGRVTGDTFAPVRALLAGGRTAHKRSAPGPRRTRYGGRRGPLGALGSAPSRPALPARSGPARATGRWSLLPPAELDPTLRALATAELLLDRYGVVTRGAVAAEEVPGGFAGVYRVLGKAEESGRVRRGYFVEGLGASQFGTAGAVDRLRAGSGGTDAAGRRHRRPWRRATPPTPTAPPSRGPSAPPTPPTPAATSRSPTGAAATSRAARPGAVVVLVDGVLALYVERGGKTLLTYSDDADVLAAAAGRLADAVRRGHLGRITVEKADGGQLLGSDHPVVAALEAAGFHLTPRGLRMRR